MTRIVIRNGNLFDSTRGELLEGRTLVVEGEKIVWVGDDSDFEGENGDHVISAEGMTILPGMMDLHVHLSYNHSLLTQMERQMLRYRDSWWLYVALRNAQEYVKYGFTTLRGCGGHEGMASLRRAFDEGLFPGPRLKLALRTIGQPGNQELFGPRRWVEVQKEEFPMSGTDGVIHAVRERKAEGSDHIKTTTTGGVLHGQESKVERSLWRDEELEAMVDEAERLGMYVAAHAHAEAGVMSAVRAGVRSIEHGTMLSDEIVKEMKRRETYLVATQSAGTFIKFAGEKVRQVLLPEVIEKWNKVADRMIESHRLALEKGVTIALGTDAPVAGEHCHSPLELQLMVENIGMSPAQALQAATINAAEVIQMENQLGSLEVGKLADVVVVCGNPLEDIGVLKNPDNVLSVLKGGHVLKS